MIKLKRVYEPAIPEDGFRILVERLWPRGVTKGKAALDAWLKEAAPSPPLRKWYGHDPGKWDEFKRRYQMELDNNPTALVKLRSWIAEYPVVTFTYAAKDERLNSAAILRDYVQGEPD